MIRTWFVILILLCLFPISALGLYVTYDCSVVPENAIPPWDIIGSAFYHVSVNDGLLHLVNPDSYSWVLLERVDPAILDATNLCLEVHVMIPAGSGQNASPQIAMTSIDPALPYGNRSHFWYAVDLYPDRIAFTLIDNDNADGSKFFGSYSIPDLNVNFHTIKLCMQKSGLIRNFMVYVDGHPVISAAGENADRPINAVDIGYGLEIASGHSYWDYIRYWSEETIGVENKSWSDIKRK